MAKNIKKTKKIVIPEIVVDVNDCESIADVYVAAACAVLDKYCTCDEIEAIKERFSTHFVVTYWKHCCDCECNTKKKPGFFKRIWNWITRK